jgi:hypothetical protein
VSSPSQGSRAAAVVSPERWVWPAFARGVLSNMVGHTAALVIRAVGLVILARSLTPYDFGLCRRLSSQCPIRADRIGSQYDGFFWFDSVCFAMSGGSHSSSVASHSSTQAGSPAIIWRTA